MLCLIVREGQGVFLRRQHARPVLVKGDPVVVADVVRAGEYLIVAVRTVQREGRVRPLQ